MVVANTAIIDVEYARLRQVESEKDEKPFVPFRYQRADGSSARSQKQLQLGTAGTVVDTSGSLRSWVPDVPVDGDEEDVKKFVRIAGPAINRGLEIEF